MFAVVLVEFPNCVFDIFDEGLLACVPSGKWIKVFGDRLFVMSLEHLGENDAHAFSPNVVHAKLEGVLTFWNSIGELETEHYRVVR